MSSDQGREGANPPEWTQTLYEDLRAVARRISNSSSSIDATELLHESYLKPVRFQERHEDVNRAELLSASSKIFRHVMVSAARKNLAQKRGGGWAQISLSEVGEDGRRSTLDLLQLEDALAALELVDERQAKIVELRFFVGLSVAEISKELELSEKSVFNDWVMARAWLYQRLTPD